MDPATLASIKAGIESAGSKLTSIVDTIDPQFHAPLVIGTAIAEQVPALVDDVEQWLDKHKGGTPPSPEENAALAAKIAGLLAPEGPGLA